MGRTVAICIFCMVLASCASTKPILSDPRSVWCEQNSPRRDAREDTPRWELDQINATNARGVEWCGWKPSK